MWFKLDLQKLVIAVVISTVLSCIALFVAFLIVKGLL